MSHVPYDLIDDDVVKKFKQKAESRGRHVQRVQFHTGVQIGNRVRNSLDADVDQVYMHLVEHGVQIETVSKDTYIVGMPDILWVKLK
jgi:hypothetical protein